MQRRKVESPGKDSVDKPEVPIHPYQKKPRSFLQSLRRRTNLLTRVLLVTAALLALEMIMFPKEFQEVEDTTKDIVNNAYRVEQEMEGWFMHQDQVGVHGDYGDASAAMANQQSSWVDGEKKLKEQLKVLADRQSKGLDIGVPILTRYLGPDFPAWAGKDVDEKEWNAKVKAKYEEMGAEEERWKQRVRRAMEQNARQPG